MLDLTGNERDLLPDSARILVVDDEPYNVELLLFELEDRGFTVISASDGVEALERLRETDVDLALVDVMMPRMDGFELTKRIRELPDGKELPIILLTAKGGLDDKREGFCSEANDYVVKPFDIENVLARISVQLKIRTYQSRRREWTEAQSRVAMVGAAAHELAQPLAGASGYLQLLSSLKESGRLDDSQTCSRLHQVNDCLVKTRELASKIQGMVRLVLEDYACGMKIVDIHASSQLPDVELKDPDERNALVLRMQSGSHRDPNLPRELEKQGFTVVDFSPEIFVEAAEPELILLTVPDKPNEVSSLIDMLREKWASPLIPLPPLIALLPANLISEQTPGLGLLKLGVSDVMSRPFQMEELQLRMRSLIRLQRLRVSDLHTRGLAATQEIRQRALQQFMPVLDRLIEEVKQLLLSPEDYNSVEDSLFEGVEQLTAVVRSLQARDMSDTPFPQS